MAESHGDQNQPPELSISGDITLSNSPNYGHVGHTINSMPEGEQ
jgi:hypothetical protein